MHNKYFFEQTSRIESYLFCICLQKITFFSPDKRTWFYGSVCGSYGSFNAFCHVKKWFSKSRKASWYNINVAILKVLGTMEDREILKQFKEISKNLMSRCLLDSDIYPLVTALISLFNLVINITQSLKENFVTQTKNFESQINFFQRAGAKIRRRK